MEGVDELLVSASLLAALTTAAEALKHTGGNWLVGGSCGLMLHGITLDREPRDLDIYYDKAAVKSVSEALKRYAIDEPHYSQTDIYESTLSHYMIDGIQVEGVGAFRVHALDSDYSVEADYLAANHPFYYQIGDKRIPLIPLGHELLFNILRSRSDRYVAVAAAIQANASIHMPALRDILSRHRWGSEVWSQVEKLVGVRCQDI